VIECIHTGGKSAGKLLVHQCRFTHSSTMAKVKIWVGNLQSSLS
jgi:hypothetical protein